MIITFLLAILKASGFFLLDIDAMDIEEGLEDGNVTEELNPSLIDTISNACGVMILIFGVFLLIGGIFAIKWIH